MYPVLFTVFGREIGTYGVFAVIGLFLAAFLAIRLSDKYFNISFEDIMLAFIAAGLTGFLGAHILYGITNTENIIELSKRFNDLGLWEYIKNLFYMFSGMVFYGGFIGGAIGLYVFAKLYKPLKGHSKNLLDILAVVFPLFHAFGRLGCFFAGCCYGIESEFGFRIDNNHLNPSINGCTRFPVQLLESFLNLLIFAVMYYFFKKGKFKNILIYLYMIIYGIVRFSDEFLRGDTYRGFIFGISTSQFISLILIVFSIVMLIIDHLNKQKKQETTEL